MNGFRNAQSNAKIYALIKEGKIVFVGRVSQIADRFDVEPSLIYKNIRLYGTFLGMTVREATPTDSCPNVAESKKYEPKKYKDSSSVRFTRL